MPPYNVQLADLPSVPLAVVRRQVRRAELGKAVQEGCGLVWAFVRAHNLQAGRNVAIYWDGSIRLEVGVELDMAFADQDGVVRSATPAGWTATVTHIGPYDQLGAAHAAIHVWAKAHAHHLVGPNWEVYGHWQNEWNTDGSKIRTDIFYQVAPGAGSAG